MKVEFIIPGECRGKGRPRFSGFGHTYTDEKTSNYENLVKLCFLNTGACMFAEKKPISCVINVYCEIPKSVSKKKREAMCLGLIRPTKKPDCDNIAKIILDGLNKVAYADDTQVVELSISKRYTATEPGVHVQLEEIFVGGFENE